MKANENLAPLRFLQARNIACLSLRDLADKTGISHTQLNKYEKGAATPSASVLIRIAEALGVSVNFFFRADVPTLENLRFRKSSKLSVGAANSIRERAKDFFSKYLEIEEIAAHEKRQPFPCLPVSEKTPEECAELLREKWNLGDDPIPNLQQLIENKGVKIFEISQENRNFDGFSARCGKDAFLVVSSWLNEDLPRKRMTLAHELGHLLFTQDENLPEKEHENFAKRFASAFLMPRETFSKMFGWKRTRVSITELVPVKRYFGVSLAAIVYRARELNLISETYYRQFFIVRGKKGWRKEEPGFYRGEESCSRFERLVKKSVQENEISESKGADLLGISIRELRTELADVV